MIIFIEVNTNVLEVRNVQVGIIYPTHIYRVGKFTSRRHLARFGGAPWADKGRVRAQGFLKDTGHYFGNYSK